MERRTVMSILGIEVGRLTFEECNGRIGQHKKEVRKVNFSFQIHFRLSKSSTGLHISLYIYLYIYILYIAVCFNNMCSIYDKSQLSSCEEYLRF